jgi:hypothetical protein
VPVDEMDISRWLAGMRQAQYTPTTIRPNHEHGESVSKPSPHSRRFAANHWYEDAVILGVVALSVALTGAGGLSLDALVGLPLAGARWGLSAFFVGIGGAALQLAGRQVPAPQRQGA